MRDGDENPKCIEQLIKENERLRDLVLSLAPDVLRTAALNTVQNHNVTMTDVHNLMSLAEECFECAAMTNLKPAIAAGLNTAGHELLARAVEIQTKLQRQHQEKE